MVCFIQIATLITLARNDVAVVRYPALLPQIATLKTYVPSSRGVANAGEVVPSPVIARHRRCRGDLHKNNNRAVMIETKMIWFI